MADAWRARYQPQLETVRSGRREWVVLDVLHREALDDVLAELGVDLAPAARDELTLAWHRLDPWPDTVEGLARLKRRHVIAPCSNGHIAQSVNLARHAGLNEYVAAKLRVFANQGPEDVAVFNGADPALRGVELGGRARRIDFARRIGEHESSLLGEHNAANVAAAAVAAEAMGIAPGAIADGLASFPGVPHRLEQVGERDGVRFVNDSKATNVAAAAAALRSFDGGVRAILGGSLKGGGFEELADPVAERCVACYLIGEAAQRLEADLAPAWSAGVEHRRCDDLGAAVHAAASDAAAGEVVLLAPACASFDAYTDYEQRGEHFRRLVEELA